MSILFDVIIPIMIVAVSIAIGKLCYDLYKVSREK